MPRAITGESQPLKNLGTDQRSVPSRECGGEDATPLGASDGNSDELHCVVGSNSHKHGVLAILLGVTDGFTHIRCGSNLSPADFKDDVAALSPCSEASPSGSTSVTTTPSEPLPAISPAGASDMPSFASSLLLRLGCWT